MGLVALAVFLLLGMRSPYALAGVLVVSFVSTLILGDFGKIARFWSQRNQENLLSGFLTAFRKNQRRYSGLVTHLGVLMLVVGIISSPIYQSEKVVTLKVGDEFHLGKYTFKFADLHSVDGPNWVAQEGLFNVFVGDRFLTQMKPQKRLYTESQVPTTEAAIYAIHLGHLFVTIPEVKEDEVVVRALINPLVLLVWLGGAVMCLGVILNIFRSRERSPVAVPRNQMDETTESKDSVPVPHGVPAILNRSSLGPDPEKGSGLERGV